MWRQGKLDFWNFASARQPGPVPVGMRDSSRKSRGKPNVHPDACAATICPFSACQGVRNEDRICEPRRTRHPCSALYNSALAMSKVYPWGLPFLLLLSSAVKDPGPIYREMPPSESGITWVHESGRSSQHYLPETVGAGVAILDYDNDGWMDILLVNSGPAAFYHPQTPLPFCSLPQQS